MPKSAFISIIFNRNITLGVSTSYPGHERLKYKRRAFHLCSGNYRVAPPNVDTSDAIQEAGIPFCVLFMITLRSIKRAFSQVARCRAELGVLLPAAGRCRPTGALSRVMLLVGDRENSGTLSRITRRTACCYTASWNRTKGVSERHLL